MPVRYTFRRLAIGCLQVAGVVLAVFVVIRALPADPVARLVGFNATEEAYRQAKAALGLDQSLLTQLAQYVGVAPGGESGVLQGHLGESWVTGSPVAAEIAQFLPITLELLVLSFGVACLIAIPVGLSAALAPGGRMDRFAFVTSMFAGAQPEFWWGLAFIYVFFFQLGVAPAPLGLPAPGSTSGTVTGFPTLDALLASDLGLVVTLLHHWMLPVATLALVLIGPLTKMVRQNTAAVLHSEFILYARICGLPKRRVGAYTLRNTIAPSMTLIAILFGYMLGGAVLVEQVFSLGGLGQYAVRSILAFDYPAIQGVVLTITALSLGLYLLLDIAHAVIDPRVARSKASK